MIQQERIIFADELAGYMKAEKSIVYFDETTSNIWEKRTRFWQDRLKPIVQRIPNSRGIGRTVYGSITNVLGRMHYTVGSTTNWEEVLAHFESLLLKIIDPSNLVIVMDNHVSHKYKDVREFLDSKGVTRLYLPPNASYLNPVERMWGMFKSTLSRSLMALNGLTSSDLLDVHIRAYHG